MNAPTMITIHMTPGSLRSTESSRRRRPSIIRSKDPSVSSASTFCDSVAGSKPMSAAWI
jgi:hypothetical protein